MSKSRIIGSSNQFTNNTCAFGSMAGLAPTTSVRPNISGLSGFKASVVAGNQHKNDGTQIDSNTTARNYGCGLGKSCMDGKNCLSKMNLLKSSNPIGGWSTGGGTKLLG